LPDKLQFYEVSLSIVIVLCLLSNGFHWRRINTCVRQLL
jgi:hypothetical protein